jgi:predicted ATPase
MRIAISGTANQGKTTLVQDFLTKWPNFKNVSSEYRELIKKEKLPHSKKATKDSQWKILNLLVEEMQKYTKEDNVVFDRCTLDNLVYSLWCCDKKVGRIDEKFIEKCIPLVRESYKFLDIIFFLPITKVAPVPIINDGKREVDEVYIKEIDALFKSMVRQYTLGLGKTPFFPADDCPGIIEIFGSREERIEMIKFYIDVDGDLIGGDVNSPDNLFNPENLNEMQRLIESQKTLKEKEIAYAGELAKIKDFVKKTGEKF